VIKLGVIHHGRRASATSRESSDVETSGNDVGDEK